MSIHKIEIGERTIEVLCFTVIFQVLNVADVTTTKFILEHGGIEAMPVSNWLILNWGFEGLMFAKIMFASVFFPLLLLFNYELFNGRRVGAACISLMGAVVAWNSVSLLIAI